MESERGEVFLSPKELGARQGRHEVTLCRDRGKGKGPKYIRVGSSIRYRLSDVLAWEKEAEGK